MTRWTPMVIRDGDDLYWYSPQSRLRWKFPALDRLLWASWLNGGAL